MASSKESREHAGEAWRAYVLTRVQTLEDLASMWRSEEGLSGVGMEALEKHLHAAERAAAGMTGGRRRFLRPSADAERAFSHLAAAEAQVYRMAPPDFLQGHLPTILGIVRQHLPADRPSRQRLEEIADSGLRESWDRESVVAAFADAQATVIQNVARMRSFRAVVLVTAGLLVIVAVGLALFGALTPSTLPLCLVGESVVVCPSQQRLVAVAEVVGGRDEAIQGLPMRYDYLVVELMGLIGGSVGAVLSLRRVRGTSVPYGLPIALALLKLPVGAVTAVIGVVLLGTSAVAGLTDVDSRTELFSWALLFGFAQQLITRPVDGAAVRLQLDVERPVIDEDTRLPSRAMLVAVGAIVAVTTVVAAVGLLRENEITDGAVVAYVVAAVAAMVTIGGLVAAAQHRRAAVGQARMVATDLQERGPNSLSAVDRRKAEALRDRLAEAGDLEEAGRLHRAIVSSVRRGDAS